MRSGSDVKYDRAAVVGLIAGRDIADQATVILLALGLEEWGDKEVGEVKMAAERIQGLCQALVGWMARRAGRPVNKGLDEILAEE